MAKAAVVTEASSLGEKQELHARCVSKLLTYIHQCGYAVRLKELQRGPQQAEWNATHCSVRVQSRRCGKHISEHAPPGHKFKKIGIKNSLHRLCLALDLVLVYKGEVTWLDGHYKKFGEYWESLHPLCCWGGRFRDGGHFSVTHKGKK